MAMPGLTPGRIVHYVYGERHLPAIVTNVYEASDEVDLVIFGLGVHDTTAGYEVYHDPNGADDTWHWIEKA